MLVENATGRHCIYTACAQRPCNYGTCVSQSASKFRCHCPDGYAGRNCEITLAIFHKDAGLSFSSMFAICICFLALLGSYGNYILYYLWWLLICSHPICCHGYIHHVILPWRLPLDLYLHCFVLQSLFLPSTNTIPTHFVCVFLWLFLGKDLFQHLLSFVASYTLLPGIGSERTSWVYSYRKGEYKKSSTGTQKSMLLSSNWHSELCCFWSLRLQ